MAMHNGRDYTTPTPHEIQLNNGDYFCEMHSNTCMRPKPRGKIKLIVGPMFSGKTSELMRIVETLRIAKRKCIIICHNSDSRYTDREEVVSHNKNSMLCIKTETIESLIDPMLLDYDVIAIDEGQFFSDVSFCADKLAGLGKTVIIAGLNSTFEKKPFPSISECFALAEEIIKLNAVCIKCYNDDATFSFRSVKDKHVKLVGHSNMYQPLCRDCYYFAEQEKHNYQTE